MAYTPWFTQQKPPFTFGGKLVSKLVLWAQSTTEDYIRAEKYWLGSQRTLHDLHKQKTSVSQKEGLDVCMLIQGRVWVKRGGKGRGPQLPEQVDLAWGGGGHGHVKGDGSVIVWIRAVVSNAVSSCCLRGMADFARLTYHGSRLSRVSQGFGAFFRSHVSASEHNF